VFGDIKREIRLEDPRISFFFISFFVIYFLDRKSTAEFECILDSVGFRVIIALNGAYFLLLIVYGSFLSLKLRLKEI